jgi:hypothetical protein
MKNWRGHYEINEWLLDLKPIKYTVAWIIIENSVKELDTIQNSTERKDLRVWNIFVKVVNLMCNLKT